MVHVGTGPQRQINRYDLSVFYKSIIKAAHLKKEDLNLEGAVIRADMLYLFNRGENLVASCPLDELLLHLREGAICPRPRISRVRLPTLNNAQAGFSGVTLLPGTSSVLFTASVEHTEDWVADGEVSGSFIGLLDLPTGAVKEIIPASQAIRGADGRIMQAKVESMAVAGNPSPGRYHLLMVIDNDDGISELIKAEVSIVKIQ